MSRKEWREFFNSVWPWIIGAVIAIGCGLLSGCATLNEPMIFPEQIAPAKEQQELCAIIYDSVRWLMARAGFCSGWDRT